MESDNEPNPPFNPIVKPLFAVIAIAMLAAAAFLYIFPDALGLDNQTAVLLAVAFGVTGIADLIIWKNWEKIFNRQK